MKLDRLAWSTSSKDPRIAAGQQSPLEKKILDLCMLLGISEDSEDNFISGNFLFFKKLNIELAYDPAIPLLDTDPKEVKAETKQIFVHHVHNNIIHNCQKIEATEYTSING
ncbi:uncharacterized protein [Symphalangus syndactylus]|uniref:uncharacterized protein isoform X2 n=1 Tax=Symphalangus syndactylus TaxID=9590 RepID=UPI003003FE85